MKKVTKDHPPPITAWRVLAAVAGLIIVIFAWWNILASNRGTGETTAFEHCVAKGVAYFEQVGSYPNLSTGETARRAAARCVVRTFVSSTERALFLLRNPRVAAAWRLVA